MSALSLNDRLQNLSEEIQYFMGSLDGDASDLPIQNSNLNNETLAHFQAIFANLQQEADLLHLPRWNACRKLLAQIRTDLQRTAAKVQQVRYTIMSRLVSGPVTRRDNQDFYYLEETARMIQEQFAGHPGPFDQTAHDSIQIFCANAEIEIAGKRIGDKSNQVLDHWRAQAKDYSL